MKKEKPNSLAKKNGDGKRRKEPPLKRRKKTLNAGEADPKGVW